MLIINQIIYNFNYQKLSWFSVFVFFKIVVVFTATGIDQIHSEETGSQINWQIYRYKSYWTTKLYKKVRRFWFMLAQSLANLATTKHLNVTCTIFFLIFACLTWCSYQALHFQSCRPSRIAPSWLLLLWALYPCWATGPKLSESSASCNARTSGNTLYDRSRLLHRLATNKKIF